MLFLLSAKVLIKRPDHQARRLTSLLAMKPDTRSRTIQPMIVMRELHRRGIAALQRRRRAMVPGGALRHQHRRAFEPSGAEIGERLIRLIQPVPRRARYDADFRRLGQELNAILSRQIGDREDLPLLPQQSVGETWNIAHVDAGADHPAAL